MSNSSKTYSNKEAQAQKLNEMEKRALSKSIKSLTREIKYATKLQSLDHRFIKVNYKRLKENVAKIKSYLSADEIVELRKLEEEGKLLPKVTSVNLNAAIKIAATARRLKLENHPMLFGRRPRSSTTMSMEVLKPKKLLDRPSTTGPTLKRSNSVTGVFIDAPEPDQILRRSSIDGGVTLRPMSAIVPGMKDSEEIIGKRSRPSSSTGIDREKTGLDREKTGIDREKTGIDREKTSMTKVSFKTTENVTNSTSHYAPYSSHKLEKDSLAPPLRSARDTKSSAMDDSIESNFGDDLFEEKRQLLLQEESARASALTQKTKSFLEKIDGFISENPPVDIEAALEFMRIRAVQEKEEVEEEQPVLTTTRRLQRRSLDFERTFINEESYKKRGADAWKDLNKCRYLRIPDERIDHSGVVTLAKDQMKFLQLLRTTEPAHIIQHSALS
ncbi:hypothetical protein ACJMK2_043299 [Sinanodonta woodiana]|uniref:Uncharacterized protein n=1 Tax=Sinanodonta woodiana TaxID=1069815 RepID=A0ABD3VWI1_SINWO